MDGEEPPPDEVGLRGLAQTQSNIGFAHAEIELFVAEDQFYRDVGVEFEKLADAGCQPVRADAERRRDPQLAVRLLSVVAEARLHRIELRHHLLDRAVEDVALLGQDQSACMPMEERRLQLALERADLAADRRLAEPQRFARMREGAGLGGGVENAQLVPVQNASSPLGARG